MASDDEPGGIDLPASFDEWPAEDQAEYLEHTKTKRELIDGTFDVVGLDNSADGGANPSLKKADWVALYRRVSGVDGASNDG